MNDLVATRFLPIFIVASIVVGCGSDSTSSVPECGADLSEDECYAFQRDPDSEQVALATAIAGRYIAEHPPEEELFDWTSGVLMFALTELYRVTGDAEIRDYYKAYLDHHIEEGYLEQLDWSDSCPPGLTALALLREEEDPAYRQVVDDILAYLEQAPRTEEGGIVHLGNRFGLAAPGIWLDSLFMFGMVLNRHGEASDDVDALALMSQQLGVFQSQLQSEQGLMVHADQWILDFDTDIYWARGNGWVVASLADYLRIQTERGESDETASAMFEGLVEGALATQDSSGLWWTVTNRPGEGDNYLETSGPALFAYGLARGYRSGVLGARERDAAKRAVAAVQERVAFDDQGRPFVTGISGGTEPSTFEVYVSLPQGDDINYGVGAVILALIETAGL